MRRTRLLVTLGPSTLTPEAIGALLDAGADAIRVNFSHGDDDQHRTLLRAVADAAKARQRTVARVADLQGPKVRIGPVPGAALIVKAGERLRFVAEGEPSDPASLTVSIPDLAKVASVGSRIVLGDGVVDLKVERIDDPVVTASVVHGGIVGSHQGFFLPEAKLRVDCLGEKDRHDLEVAVACGIEWIALSFVQSAEDVRLARELVARQDPEARVGIMAKMERQEALAHAGEILEAADAIMVARGDLGIETPLEELAFAQKSLIRQANQVGKPAVVATQMLLSMVNAARPTRAEATDVVNAVLDGADGLMLSDETAVGSFPAEATAWLARLATAAEAHLQPVLFRDPKPLAGSALDESAVAGAAVRLAEEVKAGAIVVPTHSGRTARMVSRLRPGPPILALSSQPGTAAALAFTWGVTCRPINPESPLDTLREAARLAAQEAYGLAPGSRIVLTAGYPVEGRPSNLVALLEV